MKDLFETPELIPANVLEAFEKHNKEGEFTYAQLAEILKAVEALGYTFEYYLDAEPFNLRVRSNLDYIIERSGVTSDSDKELIEDAYNRYFSLEWRENIFDMFVCNGFVYHTTHLHKPIEQTYCFVDKDGQMFFTETKQQMETYLLNYKN